MDIANENQLKEHYENIWSSSELREEPYYYRWILSLLTPSKGMKLLDIASGAGLLLHEAEKCGLETYGIDISENAIAKARKLCAKTAFIQGSAENLPFPDASFDFVTCLGSLEHFLHPAPALLEMKRVLKITGTACIVVPNYYFEKIRTLFGGTKHTQEVETFYTPKSASALIENNGELRIAEVHGYNPSGRDFDKDRLFKRFNGLKLSLYRLFSRYIPLRLSYSLVFICTK